MEVRLLSLPRRDRAMLESNLSTQAGGNGTPASASSAQ